MVSPAHDHPPTLEPSLRVVEVFGPTVQGEGPTVGYATHILRLAGCNLTCVWCDTSFSWDPSRQDPDRLPRPFSVGEVLQFLDPRCDDPAAAVPAVRRLVITGGEPLLQAVALTSLCERLHHLGWVLEIETSGSVLPGPLTTLIDRFNVSPKLAHSGVTERARIRWAVLKVFAAIPHASFKFVACTIDDLAEAAAILDQLEPPVDPSRVMVMAEGTDTYQVLERSRDLVDAVVARGWGMTPRWHSLLWGDERGR